MSRSDSSTLRPSDYLLLLAFCVLLFGFALVWNRPLTTHEAVHCVNVREMMYDGDLIIPHYGGRPWLERPPVPFWFTLPLVHVFGDGPVVFRLASLLIALPAVLLVGWMASLWYGRSVGLLSGLIFATMREFTHYATGPEADIFLCTVVTGAVALFVWLEFGDQGTEEDREAPATWTFFGDRPLAMLGFFVVLGLANLVKGLFFGDLFILLPIAAFLLLRSDRFTAIRRYVWAWGWLAFVAVGSCWALAAYQRHPDIVDLWLSDYAGRVNTHYMREPLWYYVVNLPWNIFPWSIVGFLGLGVTARAMWTQERSPERFLWCWALVPLVFFSLMTGKHHHYLLQGMAPWAVLGALGTVRLWGWLREQTWLKPLWPALALAITCDIALVLLSQKMVLPWWFQVSALVAVPLIILVLWSALVYMGPREAAVALFGVVLVGHWAGHALHDLGTNRYGDDLAFVERVKDHVADEETLLVLDNWGPLDASWLLFNLQRGTLLHNPSFLVTHAGQGDVFLVARRHQEPILAGYGKAEALFESRKSRGETGPGDRLTLYRFRFHPWIARTLEPVYISPMQATGRAQGPEVPATGWLPPEDAAKVLKGLLPTPEIGLGTGTEK